MKNIGIITYHASHNIGSMLQSYALQTYLENTYDCKVEFIDYASPDQRNMYAVFPKMAKSDSLLKYIVKTSIRGIFYPWLKKRFDDFESFKNTYLKLSEHNYMYSEQINELESKYDYIFLGSDQIWNSNCEDFTNVYFANFNTKAKLVAYAPSLGGKNLFHSNLDLDYIKQLIDKMEHLSVREINGKKWLDKLTNKSFEITVDPTLLINKSHWNNFLTDSKVKTKHKDYIFFYGVPFSEKTYPILEEISKKLGLKVVMMNVRSYFTNHCYKRGFILEKESSPLDYLSLIKNSSLVITTSFHGTIFSTVFEKDFWTVTFEGTNTDDDRVDTLLKHLGLEERLIYLENIENIDLSKKVDYSDYDSNLEPLISKSKSFIDKSLDKEK